MQLPPTLGLRDFMQLHPGCDMSIADIADNSLRSFVERYCEQRCASVPMPDDRILCRILGRYLTWVDARDRGLSPHLIFQGYWEMWITAAIARYARAGTTTIDIGANVGYYSMLLAEAVGAEGRVVAFEPNPRIAEMLEMSVSINGYASRVSVRREAVAEASADSLTFAIPKHEPKNAALVKNDAERASFQEQFGDNLQFIDVPSRSLDSLNLSNVGVVKIDAEGAEREIWRGMQATVERNPDICIFMELNASRGYDALAFHEELSTRFPVRHVDFDGEVRPLTPNMLTSERTGADWMLFLCRN